jgi:threonine dehydratase
MTARPQPDLTGITAGDIHAARERIRGTALHTPLVRLHVDAPAEIWLKLENLQPIGSFKIRGAINAMRALPSDELARGVYTASAGNMAQGVAWGARELGVACTVLVPDHAPRTKLDAITRLGARYDKLPFAEWWQVLVDNGRDGMPGAFIHPVANRDVIAGNGTVGLEIADALPDVSTVFVPYGGGGLACGIAIAMRATVPGASVFACEVDTAAPLAASLRAGAAVSVDYTPSFVDGIGGRSVLPSIWPLASALLAGSRVVTVEDARDSVRLLVNRARVVAEGAGAASVAAALAWPHAGDRVVCVVSGGNIDAAVLAKILIETGAASR